MCEVQSQMDAGTHFVFLAKVVDAKKGDSGGYVYDGDDFESEPDDYVCPVCGAKKDMFKLQ